MSHLQSRKPGVCMYVHTYVQSMYNYNIKPLEELRDWGSMQQLIAKEGSFLARNLTIAWLQVEEGGE